jgi:hypothetical protein
MMRAEVVEEAVGNVNFDAFLFKLPPWSRVLLKNLDIH